MKKIQFLLFWATLVLISFYNISCNKKNIESEKKDVIPEEVISRLKSMNFNTNGIEKAGGGYIVEGDMFLPDKNIFSADENMVIRIANEEQYRTNNVVTGLPRTITVSVDAGLPIAYTTATDAAIARYTAIANPALCLQFQRVAANGMIRIVNGSILPVTDGVFTPAGVWGRASSAPTGGNPGFRIGINVTDWGANPNANALTTCIAHEMGHTIGMRHTDYMNRAFSQCLVNAQHPANEGPGDVGAVHIPGTPTSPELNSWMLACMANNTNRPFTANDIIALRAIYGCAAFPAYTIRTSPCGGIYTNSTIAGFVGDIVTLRLTFGGYLNWDNMSNGAGAAISITAAGQSQSISTPHYYGSSGFSLSRDITITLPSTVTSISTSVVVHNSTTMTSSTATLTVISVNGTPANNQAVVCGGNSGGSW